MQHQHTIGWNKNVSTDAFFIKDVATWVPHLMLQHHIAHPCAANV